MLTEFYLIIVTTLAFTTLSLVWLCYLLNTDMFLKFGLRLCRSYAGMKVHHVSRKNGRGIWCYAEKGRPKHHHGHHRHHKRHHSRAYDQHKQSYYYSQQYNDYIYHESSSDDSISSSPSQSCCINQTTTTTPTSTTVTKVYPTLVFLHGFGGDKDTWPSILKGIPSQYHCIVVDLPGHGDVR